MRWGYAWAGLGALAVVAIIGILLAANSYGVWLVALLPLGVVGAGAVLLAGRTE